MHAGRSLNDNEIGIYTPDLGKKPANSLSDEQSDLNGLARPFISKSIDPA